MQIFKDGVAVTQELRVLRLLSNVSSPISLTAIVVVKGLKISDLIQMKKDGLILMNDDVIKITDKGRKAFKESLDEKYL